MERLLWVCLAGAVGCGARYLLGLWASERLGPGFPYGTLFVNVLGCFLMGLIAQVAVRTASMPVDLKLALTTGFLGGLTTYSSFNQETTKLLQDGAYRAASINFGVTVTGCFLAGALGTELARRIVAD